jgi:hypothetical protein
MRKETRITATVLRRPYPPVMATDLVGVILYVFVALALVLASAGRVRFERLVPARVPIRR